MSPGHMGFHRMNGRMVYGRSLKLGLDTGGMSGREYTMVSRLVVERGVTLSGAIPV